MDSNKGISPAVGVILLIGITAAVATLAGIVLLDLGSPSQSAQAGVETVDTPNGVEVSWNQQGSAESVKVIVDGQEIATLNGVNESVTIGANKGTEVSVIGVKDGDEQVISKTETEYGTGSGTVKDYNANTETVSGSVSINPDIPNATVKSVANGQVLETTTTDSNGAFTIGATKNAKLQVIVKGFTYNSNPELYASDEKSITSMSETVNFEFESSNAQTVSINGSNKWIINNSDANGNKTIGSVEQLQSVKADLSSSFTLISDIDASPTSSWNGSSGFEPIGDSTTEFNGDFNGNGHTITNLYIDRSTESRVGLFGEAISTNITNLNLENVDVTGKQNVGGLVGLVDNSSDSSLQSITVSGSVSGTEANIGGLVGTYRGSDVVDLASSATVNGGSAVYVNAGGLIGHVDKDGGGPIQIKNSYSTGSITANGEIIGGLIGLTTGDVEINQSYSTSSIDAQGNEPIGGLVGSLTDKGSVTRSYTNIEITNGDFNAGGLVGVTRDNASISESYSKGSINSTNAAAGLVGFHRGNEVTNSYSKVNLSGSEDGGGALGNIFSSDSTIKNVYAVGSVSGGNREGGFAARIDDVGTMENTYWDTESTGQSTSAGSSTGLSSSELQGETASSNLTGFDFTDVWTTTDGYPELQNNREQ